MPRRRPHDDQEETGEGPDQFPGEPPIPASRADMQLVRRADRERWPIPPALRRLWMARIAAATRSDLCTPKTLNAIGKTLAQLDKLNMEQAKRDELGTAAQVVQHEHSGRVEIDVKTLTDAQLQQLIDGTD